MTRRLLVASTAAAALVGLAVLSAGCAPPRTLAMAPSLGPVDPGRAMVRYKPIQGYACGPGSLLNAVWDMKRLVGVDGYVEILVEEEGAGQKRCTTVTGYPFTYGTEAKAIRVRGMGAPEPLAPEPAAAAAPRPAPTVTARPAPTVTVRPAAAPATAAPATASIDCPSACETFASYAGTTALIRRVVKERCVARCEGGDTAYQTCIRAAARTEDVKRCNAN